MEAAEGDIPQKDHGYRYNEDLTAAMATDEIWRYLSSEAERLAEVNEFEVSYGIYKELVWRFPRQSASWHGLARLAEKMGKASEARDAQRRAAFLVEKD